MTNYVARPLPVEAFKYKNEQLKDLPAWLRSYQDFSPMGGQTPVARTPISNLLIPTPERMIEVFTGEWIVLYAGKISKYKEDQFNARFEAVAEGLPATAEVVETPPPAPVEPPAPAPVADTPAPAPVAEAPAPAPIEPATETPVAETETPPSPPEA